MLITVTGNWEIKLKKEFFKIESYKLSCLLKRTPLNFQSDHAEVAQLVERQPSKLNVEGSNPFSRSHTICRPT